MKKPKIDMVLTTPRVAGGLLIILSAVLCFVQPDNAKMYWTTGIPAAAGLLTADSVGYSFGRNKNDKIQ